MYGSGHYGVLLPYQDAADEDVDEYIRSAGYGDEGRALGYLGAQRSYQPNMSRQTQATTGRARLSLPPPPARTSFEADDYSPYLHAAPEQYANDSFESVRQYLHAQQEHRHGSSSSPANALPSSPTFQASQRQQIPESLIPVRSQGPIRSQQKLSDAQRKPIVQGIELVPVHFLPDRFRTIFPFAMFNAVQSACFESIYESNNNCVLSSPTGSGKTVLFEIAICHLLRDWQNGTFKVVYMAPTKSLCSERARDWRAKFGPLDLKCEEMTSDSDVTSLHHVQRADIIVTTPEKWDSMTRKWKDHEKLVRLIKLLLIDEVHILNKDRGAALEVVVSRMKSIGSGTRFVALSATVPNSQDIAAWLGRNSDTPAIPAIHKRFGEEFRPVELKRHVCGYQSNANPFGFDTILKTKLPDVISKYSQKKPIMVFCFTRKSCAEAASFLAQWWQNSAPRDRFWNPPTRPIKVEDKGLLNTVPAGVAIHHAGLSSEDRNAVERAYLAGELNVICCTSTLAVGINLPCHMVIIKNTVSYEAGAVKEYSDLEIMQMIGRAGRPQFDSSALAIIMTKLQQVKHYEQLLSGQERLESCLHLNLVEHLNAEIGLGMVPDLCSAKKWLAGTFLKVRLEDNPTHYRIQGDSPDQNLGARLEQICASSISRLENLDLIETVPLLRTTEYGEAMARYYMNITTMESILGLPQKPKISEILSVISQAHEFREIRFRAGEKQVYKEMNDLPDIRFPIKVDLSAVSHKVSLIIQSVLGRAGHVADQLNQRVQYNIDQSLIFQHVHRLIRCIVDCQNTRKDAIGIRNSLMLSRSLAARVWDDSPMVLQQIEQIGPVALRKLVSAKITTMEELASTEPGRLELVLGKAPPFGWTIYNRIQTFPRLRVSLQMVGEPIIKPKEHVMVKMKIDFGFLNEKTPVQCRNKPVFVIALIGTSDGQQISFLRISVQKLERMAPVNATALLTSPSQLIECYVMCDDLAGTMQQAVLKPNIPTLAFQSIKDLTVESRKEAHTTGISRAAKPSEKPIQPQTNANDEWDDGGLDDDDFFHAEPNEDEFMDVDEFNVPATTRATKEKASHRGSVLGSIESTEDQRLENGNFACGHGCKDKSACRHPCCKEGVKKKSKSKKVKESETSSTAKKSKAASGPSAKTQSRLDLPYRKKVSGPSVEHIDLSQTTGRQRSNPPLAATKLARLHGNTTGSSEIPLLRAVPELPVPSVSGEKVTNPKFVRDLDRLNSIEEQGLDEMLTEPRATEDYEDRLLEDDDEYLDRDEDMLDAALIGLQDSQELLNADQDIELGRDMEEIDVPNMEPYDMLGEYSSEAALFVTPRALQDEEVTGELDDAMAMLDGGGDEITAASPGTVKRKREESVASTYFLAKKVRQEYEEACQSHDGQEEEGEDKEKEQDNKEREVEELRAWLAAELGDSVEMVG